MQLINEQIKQLRIQHQLSQLELAKLAGVSHVTLCKIETGVNSNFEIQILYRLAKALNASLHISLIKNLSLRENGINQENLLKLLDQTIIKTDAEKSGYFTHQGRLKAILESLIKML